jgi:hypothetical protein
MATTTKQKDDYQTYRIPLFGNPTNRLASASKDQLFYNLIFDVIENKLTNTKTVYCSKRGALTATTTVDAGGGVGRGIYYWARTGKTYSVIDNVLYSNTTSIQTLATSTGTCWFHEATGSSDVLLIGDGTDLYTISLADSVTDITDADLPASPITPVSLDGYVFVIKSGTDEIYNSDVDAPTAWTAANFISAEMYPDNLVALVRQVNYIGALGTFSCEFFYDNENASGSPLRRNESIAIRVGLAARDSLAQTDRKIVFVGQSNDGEPSVWMFDGLTPSKISTEFQDKILYGEGSNLSSCTGNLIRHKGHSLYVLNLSARTLVYDIEEKIWSEWSIVSAGNHAVMPFAHWTQGANNTVMALHNSDGKIYKLDPTLYQDDAGVIKAWIITTRVDNGNNKQKRQFRAELVCDAESAGTATIEWSDDDYQNWKTARTLDLTKRAFTKAGGIFRRRAYRIKHESNNPFRAEALELELSEGVH